MTDTEMEKLQNTIETFMQIVFGSNCKLAPARGNASSQTKRQRPDCKQLHVRWACFSIYPVYRHRTALLRLVILWSCGTMSSRWWWSFYICIMFLLHWVFCLWISYFFTLLIWIMICRFVSPPLDPDLIISATMWWIAVTFCKKHSWSPNGAIQPF